MWVLFFICKLRWIGELVNIGVSVGSNYVVRLLVLIVSESSSGVELVCLLFSYFFFSNFIWCSSVSSFCFCFVGCGGMVCINSGCLNIFFSCLMCCEMVDCVMYSFCVVCLNFCLCIIVFSVCNVL